MQSSYTTGNTSGSFGKPKKGGNSTKGGLNAFKNGNVQPKAGTSKPGKTAKGGMVPTMPGTLTAGSNKKPMKTMGKSKKK